MKPLDASRRSASSRLLLYPRIRCRPRLTRAPARAVAAAGRQPALEDLRRSPSRMAILSELSAWANMSCVCRA